MLIICYYYKIEYENRNLYILPYSYPSKMNAKEKGIYERLKENAKKPKAKISISVNREDLKEFKELLSEHFPDVQLSGAFNELMLDGIEELKEVDEEAK